MRFRGVSVAMVAGVVFALFAGVAGAAESVGAGASASSSAAGASTAAAVPTAPGAFVSLEPTRIWDTRPVWQDFDGPVAGYATERVQVANRGGVPPSGASAVVLNVTVTQTKGSGYVTAYPDGAARPNASNVNFGSGQTVANLVTVKLGSNGKVAFYNGSSKSIEMVFDVAGYYVGGTPSQPGAFVSLDPNRILDTRSGLGASGPVEGKQTVHLQVSGRGGVPSSGVSAVVLNVTATRAKARGYVTAFPDGATRPQTSNVNFGPKGTVANLVTVKMGSNGKVALFNGSSDDVELVADVAGYYRSGTVKAPGMFVAMDPTRILDTRSGNGTDGPVAAKRTVHLQTAQRGVIRSTGVSAVVLNVTVTAAKAGGYVTAFPDGTTRPVSSNVNFVAGRTVANVATVKLGTNGSVSLYNSSSKTMQLVGDVAGYFLSKQVLTATMVDTGGYTACAVTSAGGVKCWGSNYSGQQGNGTNTESVFPTNVQGLSSGVTAVSVGQRHACALTNAGAVKCWGANDYGVLGNGSTTDSWAPVAVQGLSSGVKAIAAGGEHTCALLTTGGVKCWGRNLYGELGNGLQTGSLVPQSVSGLSSGVTALTVGAAHTCALTSAGGVKCWGYNAQGEVGNGSNDGLVLLPAAVSGLSSGVKTVIADDYYTCALTTTGAEKCWGDNFIGQLGIGNAEEARTPVTVAGLSSGVKSIGGQCAVLTAGGVKCWGRNWDGALATGTTTSSSVPVTAKGIIDPIGIAGDERRRCSVSSGGLVQCWGSNDHGMLGVGDSGDAGFRSTRPVIVSGF